MRVLLDATEVVRFAVQDARGRLYPEENGEHPRPHCAQCHREVDGLGSVTVRGDSAVVYVVCCHGMMDVVRFMQDDGCLLALPAFSSIETRCELLAWLAAGALEDPVL